MPCPFRQLLDWLSLDDYKKAKRNRKGFMTGHDLAELGRRGDAACEHLKRRAG